MQQSNYLAVAIKAICAASLFSVNAAHAQLVSSGQSAPEKIQALPAIVVTGTPLGSDLFDMAPPASVLAGEKLKQRLQPTLGETLANEVGVNSTYYGPNASRPVIRGLDGEHIRILQNGVGTVDASGTSVDHAVSLDPLLVQRIEVVRGPATLLYGGSAVGGVVNVIDNRIPTEAVADFNSEVEARYGSVNQEKSAAAVLESGTEHFVWHLDGFKRDTSDLKIPGFARSDRLRRSQPLPSGEEEARDRLPNSASSSDGGGLGGSYVWDKGYIGASGSVFNTDYGTVAEEDVTIKMRQKRGDVAAEVRDISPVVKSMKFKFGYSDYTHTEFEGDEAGTVFKNQGYEGRFDLVHNRLGLLEGAVGLQVQEFKFSALGDEAFLPTTRTKIFSGFLYEELPLGAIKFQFGVRLDRHNVEAEDDASFGAGASRTLHPKSGSFGLIWSLDKQYALALSSSYTERAPNYQELFANGPHLATDAFEVGDRNLGVEKSTGIDLALRKRSGLVTGSIGVFYNRFNNFVTLAPTGVVDPTFNLEVFNYVPVPAEFKGAEAEATWHMFKKPEERFNLELRSDYTRANNRNTGEPLPRISPWRFGVAGDYEHGRFGSRVEVQRVQKQDRVTANELPTDGYTMLNASMTYRFKAGPTNLSAFLRGTNLLNQEARNHVSFLKDIAPLGGRAVIVGLNAKF